jgi:hypothetical protein
MTKKKGAASLENPREKMGEHMRAISTTVRENLAGSLCSKEQAEYDLRLAASSEVALPTQTE